MLRLFSVVLFALFSSLMFTIGGAAAAESQCKSAIAIGDMLGVYAFDKTGLLPASDAVAGRGTRITGLVAGRFQISNGHSVVAMLYLDQVGTRFVTLFPTADKELRRYYGAAEDTPVIPILVQQVIGAPPGFALAPCDAAPN